MSYLGAMIATYAAIGSLIYGGAWLWDRLTLPRHRRQFAKRRHPSAGRGL